ncbi:MAG: hypothetical protein RMK18_12375, partial [Armatimonadota bacterium]|nr:hypothetical protein [Armatimonadota bacterium]
CLMDNHFDEYKGHEKKPVLELNANVGGLTFTIFTAPTHPEKDKRGHPGYHKGARESMKFYVIIMAKTYLPKGKKPPKEIHFWLKKKRGKEEEEWNGPCWGFAAEVYNHVGFNLPDTKREQYDKTIKDEHHVKARLIFFWVNATAGKNYPQKFRECISRLFYHDGKYWHSDTLDVLIELLPEQQRESIKAHIVGVDPAKLWCIVSWTHNNRFRLEKIIPVNKRMTAMIHGIDRDGNFYVIGFELFKGYFDFLLNFLFKFKPLAKGMQYFGICDPKKRRIKAIKIFSSDGGILDVIPITFLIKQPGDEIEKVPMFKDEEIRYFWKRSHYGQIVKIDETGIYLEVVFGSWHEPREYRIVRIEKKQRWKVWWERLTKRMER